MSTHDGGTHVEWWVEGRGMRANSCGWEFVLYIKTHFYGEHSLHISWRSTHLLHLYFPFSWWRHQMEHVPRHWLFCGEFTGDCGEFTVHQWIPLTQTSDAELWWFLWTNGWVSNQDAGDLRRHRAHYDVTVMWCRVVMGGGGGGGLYPDYHSLQLTIYFALSGSLGLCCQIIHKLDLSWGWHRRTIRSL